jgi:hypothetical protein
MTEEIWKLKKQNCLLRKALGEKWEEPEDVFLTPTNEEK